jgi:hypothetical protein
MSIIPRTLQAGRFVLLHFRVRHRTADPVNAWLRAAVHAPSAVVELPDIRLELPPQGRINAYVALLLDRRFEPGVCRLVTRCDHDGKTYRSLDEATDQFEVLPAEAPAPVEPFVAVRGAGSDPRDMMALYFGAVESADLRILFRDGLIGMAECAGLEGRCARDARRFHACMHGEEPDGPFETAVAREALTGVAAIPALALAAYNLLDLPQLLHALAGRPLRDPGRA